MGYVSVFHKTILKEFYQVAFRKKIYTTREELQKKTLMIGFITTIIKEPIKEKYAVTESQLLHLLIKP